MTYAIILAGGSGKRFWPLSRQNKPKQFLNICSQKPAIEETIHRILPLVNKQNIYIATNINYHKNIKGCLSKLNISLGNILFEPSSRNNFAPIALLTKKLYEKDTQALVMVLPCDHYIKQEGRFLGILRSALTAAKQGFIVSLGIKPTHPETGYGYIQINARRTTHNAQRFAVARFIEKPDLKKAKEFIQDKRYFWNGGIFVFQAGTMLEEIKKMLPRDYGLIHKISGKRSLHSAWPKLTATSIDYAVMEKTKKIALVPMDCGWVDLGSWQSLELLTAKDSAGNIFQGNCLDIGSKNSICWSEGRLLATLGLDNLIIVDTKDALLICAKDKTQDVKKLVALLKQKKLNKLL